jgi:hypothetical protein
MSHTRRKMSTQLKRLLLNDYNPQSLFSYFYLFIRILKGKGKGKGKVSSVQTHRAPKISKQSAHEVENFVILTHWPALPRRRYFLYSYLLEVESTPSP